ncbi:MAG: sn-glycerol-3-phosphate ABC transporter substrate-binding protein UgpB [Betaproteobacteria bacterium]|nr:sn-glycerol-3-phosphate ABC transporter substrate-binding protein UgpB [Betaproteobacteria bacterium]
MKAGVLRAALVYVVLCLTATPAAATLDIQFWHSMGGALGEQLEALAGRFNQSQTQFRVVLQLKGEADDAAAGALAAAQAGHAPHIVQVLDIGTAQMMSAKNGIKPLAQVMADAREPFNAAGYLPALQSYYADKHGKMLALPLNSSVPVFYFNKDAFRKAGVDPDHPPLSWPDVKDISLKLLDTQATACGFTIGWQSWYLLESMSAWHNEAFATHDNGFGGASTRLTFNNHLMIRHISFLSSWVKSELFTYAGRRDEAEAKFVSGECGMVGTSSAAYANIARNANFQFGVAQVPHYDDFKGAPFNSIVGGSALWVMAGKKPAEYVGVAKFIGFLTQPEVLAEWHQQTGYLPLTVAAYQLSRKQGFYEKFPGADTSVKGMMRRAGAFVKGVRLGNFPQLRKVFDEELEAVWAARKAPKDALDTAVARGNDLLRQFEKSGKY